MDELPKKKRFRVFCDESGQNGCRFMVLGGVIVESESIDRVSQAIANVREKYSIRGEFKWGKVSKTKLPAYIELVESFASMPSQIQYKSLIVNMSEVDYRTHHLGDKELGFYKFYWQLLYHKFNYYIRGAGECLHIVLDERCTPYSLSNLKNALNNRYIRDKSVAPVRSVEALCSKKSDFLQLADVLTGAVGWHCNGHDIAENASPARTELAQKIARIARVSRLSQETRWAATHFEIWPIRFKKKE